MNSQLKKWNLVLTNQSLEAGAMLQMKKFKSKMINQLRELHWPLIRRDTNPKDNREILLMSKRITMRRKNLTTLRLTPRCLNRRK